MNAIFYFDINTYRKTISGYALIIVLFAIGCFTGSIFRLSLGEGIYLDSAYTTGFMTAFLSLGIVFIASFIGSNLLFKEWDTRFDQVLFSTALSKRQFFTGRFVAFWLLVFSAYTIMIIGFAAGQNMRSGSDMSGVFHLVYYLYPLLLFGTINSLLVCSILFFIAIATKKRLLLVISSLLLYILYMVTMLFSSSPLMANAMPQSQSMQVLSAIADPFGISAYFFESSHFTVAQRNNSLVIPKGLLLLNRLFMTGLSLSILLIAYKKFTFLNNAGAFKKNTKKSDAAITVKSLITPLLPVVPAFSLQAKTLGIFSFVKKDLVYIFKTVALPAASILMLFHTGMEMYAEIEKGIRLPQLYATSGLMASTINENFFSLGALLVVYFVNEICWRSHSSRFADIESTCFYSGTATPAHWISSSVVILFFSVLMIAEALLFQVLYGYTIFKPTAYFGVLIFNSLPLVLFAALLVLLNNIFKNRFLALGFTLLLALIITTPVAKTILPSPLLRFLSGYNGLYSDFNCYSQYMNVFIKRLAFGTGCIGLLWLIFEIGKTGRFKTAFIIPLILCTTVCVYSSYKFMDGYQPENKNDALNRAAEYEKEYRRFENTAQPTITDVDTEIELFPSTQSYSITGKYILKNLSGKSINSILVNFNKQLKTENALLKAGKENIRISNAVQAVSLRHALLPNDSAVLSFRISYQWKAVNPHISFNNIMENGSFMRISRYYPSIGYQSANEIEDPHIRKQYGLGDATTEVKLGAPKTNPNNFITLAMTVSTESDQVAIGTGDLLKQWKKNNRNYFHYETGQRVPFRFAVSSARYAVAEASYKGIPIKVWYEPSHYENVNSLINNAKLTLEYCIQNFGSYPFRTVNFAEISAFTKGFNATAYPSVIFMAEDIAFHANVNADKKQDVINELAGHELSHLWWGNNQVSPDDREGAVMLSETLAMYTEMMLYKKLHGREKMQDRLKIHQQIYESEKGFSDEEPLYKVKNTSTHISYSKGAIIMVKLSELIGEQKLNELLKTFLQQYKYPQRPISTDFLEILYNGTENKFHAEIKKMFTGI